MQAKICTYCNIEKESIEFSNKKAGKLGIASYCKKCININSKKYYQENKEKILVQHKKWKDNHKDYQLKSLYNITAEQYNQMLEAQNCVCAICKNTESTKNYKLHVDHDHQSGKVRGLLCGKCNRMIGLANDNNEILEKASTYLKLKG